jgi:hypothetical protein
MSAYTFIAVEDKSASDFQAAKYRVFLAGCGRWTGIMQQKLTGRDGGDKRQFGKSGQATISGRS